MKKLSIKALSIKNLGMKKLIVKKFCKVLVFPLACILFIICQKGLAGEKNREKKKGLLLKWKKKTKEKA